MTNKELNDFIKGFKVGDRVTCMDPTSKCFGQQGVVFKKASYIWVKFPSEKRLFGFRRQLQVDESAKAYFTRMGFKKGDLVQISDFLFCDRNLYLGLNEKKTNKRRVIKVGGVLKELITKYYSEMGSPYLKSKVFEYTLRHTNRLLQIGAKEIGIRKKNISTHSLRKSGARFIWEEFNKSDESLIKLSIHMYSINKTIF
jgi:hypothetical protein